MPKLATLYLLILKVIYDEQMTEASNSLAVHTTLGELSERLGVFGLTGRTAPTEIRRALSLLKKYQIIEPLDLMDDLDGNMRLILYPTINLILTGNDVRELLSELGEGEGQDRQLTRDTEEAADEEENETDGEEKRRTERRFQMNDKGFKALTRICLNNWHYISHKVLSLNSGINFFTGHSGSGKSTIIDAMQIVLYANTDGRGFFNKAAADDSDRSLIEYLRGMVNIEENNRFAYLRNQNFSTTIALEFTETEGGEAQCVGVAFDVEDGVQPGEPPSFGKNS